MTKPTKPYYTLLIRYPSESQWFVQFGSYDRADVAEEQADCLDSSPGLKTRILRTADNQAAIDAAIRGLS